MDIRKDIIGNIPQIGDTIAFNPPRYSGLRFGDILGFSDSGLPKVCGIMARIQLCSLNKDNTYSPKTGFAIIKKLEENGY